MDENQARIVRMRDIHLDESLFRNYLTGTVLDELLCSYKGLPKGVNYMVIGDPGGARRPSSWICLQTSD